MLRQNIFEAIVAGDMQETLQFLNSGTDIDCRDDRKQTPLMWACREGKWEIAEMLIMRGASMEDVDSYGNRAIHHAIDYNQTNCLKLLLEHKALVDAPSDSYSLILSTISGTPLIDAATDGQLKNVKLLLEHKADVTKTDARGRTALSLINDNETYGSPYREQIVTLLKTAEEEQKAAPSSRRPGTP